MKQKLKLAWFCICIIPALILAYALVLVFIAAVGYNDARDWAKDAGIPMP